MTQQSITWPNREQHPSVRTSDPDTCREPSDVKMSNGRLIALKAHAEHAAGLTDFQLADLTGVAQTSIGKRRKELEVAGLVVATTERRPSDTGAPATVYRITDRGIAVARRLAEEVRS